jgi:hypothetical protein
MIEENFPVVLSFDVGVIHLSYCLLTKKIFKKLDGTSYVDWYILDWNNIDLTNRDEQKCSCGAKASLIQTICGESKYYCKPHSKKVDTCIEPFEGCFEVCNKKSGNMCMYKSGTEQKICGKTSSFINNKQYYCSVHAKQKYKSESKLLELKPFKIKNSSTLNFDDVKYSLIMELEKRNTLLGANYVVIENQPSFKNPRMKSIASTIYDYYLIRGIIDKNTTQSNIMQVKFMSPSNKLKIASDGDTKQLVKAKNTDDTKAYKLTKSLGIKYCLELISHLPIWITHFNSYKKRDDLADSFLQGAYFYTNILEPQNIPKNNSNENKKTNIIKQTKNKLVETGIIKKTTKKSKPQKEIEV